MKEVERVSDAALSLSSNRSRFCVTTDRSGHPYASSVPRSVSASANSGSRFARGTQNPSRAPPPAFAIARRSSLCTSKYWVCSTSAFLIHASSGSPPSLPRAITFAPELMRTLTASPCPRAAAEWSAVHRFPSTVSKLAFAATRARKASVGPDSAALWSGVAPSLSRASTEAPNPTKMSITSEHSPVSRLLTAAKCKAVKPFGAVEFNASLKSIPEADAR
mmetsp:Transcript_4949/g.17208  ORF Transcript_4949/g.17208 Transcript_4949/m.17208 type:complete len:220 (-) Transcript_4949:748-1407(-)